MDGSRSAVVLSGDYERFPLDTGLDYTRLWSLAELVATLSNVGRAGMKWAWRRGSSLWRPQLLATQWYLPPGPAPSVPSVPLLSLVSFVPRPSRTRTGRTSSWLPTDHDVVHPSSSCSYNHIPPALGFSSPQPEFTFSCNQHWHRVHGTH